MAFDLISVNSSGFTVPAVIAAAGNRAGRRFIEFFSWKPSTLTVAAYIEQLQATHAKPTVKQHLAAIPASVKTGCTGSMSSA